MRALTLRGTDQQAALHLTELDKPQPANDELLVAGLALGICGTDRGLLAHGPRGAPEGRDWLVLGHESLGRVLQAPAGSAYQPGDLVTGLVRRPDPEPCPNCAAGELDICTNDRFSERGIVRADGYGAEQFVLDPAYAVPVDTSLGLTGVLVEPASILAKAWQRLDRSVRRSGGRALVLGAGPIGLLAALFAQQRGYEVHVVDRVDDGPKVDQVRALPATYHRGTGSLTGQFDAVVECTGEVVAEALAATAPGGALCLIAGSHRGAEPSTVELAALGASLAGNRTITGIVSSAREHFLAAHETLLAAPPEWLEGLLTRVVPVEKYADAFAADPQTIKTVIQLGE